MSSLPRLKEKWFSTKLYSDGRDVKFRPFTIGEQKQLMLVKETAERPVDTYEAIVDMVGNCVKDIDIKTLYIIDLQKIFYDIRSIADGNEIKFSMKCENAECGHTNDFILDTKKDFKLIGKTFTAQYDVGNNIKVSFRQPTVNAMLTVEKRQFESDTEKALFTFATCLYQVDNAGQVLNYGQDFDVTDAVEFLDQFDSTVLKSLTTFTSDAPKINVIKEFVCIKCEHKKLFSPGEVDSFLS